MRRLALTPRPDWATQVEALGFDFHTLEGAPYWDESACWEFSAAEVDTIETAADALHQICLQAVDWVVANGRYEPFGLPDDAIRLVEESWRGREPSLYGRFDLAWTGEGAPKMLEYNADTPTALFEAAVVQWQWLEACFPGADQFNSLHEALVERWPAITAGLPVGTPLHLACVMPHAEDEGTVRYLQATAMEARLPTKVLAMAEIGWDGFDFRDLEDEPIGALFKLYPWEWMIREEFAAAIALSRVRVVEPAWKMLLSNKAMLSLLWHLNPGHPNLLPASFERDDFTGRVVRKPLLGREGANVALLDDDGVIAEEPGPYAASGWLYQEWAPLAEADGRHMVIGAWVIGDKCRGVGLREDADAITRNTSRIVPHLFR